LESLEGTLERVTFYSSDTSYMVGRLGRSGKENVTIVGYFPPLREGENLLLRGEWTTHPRYGRQFLVKEWESVTPTSRKGLERFLASGLIKGVGSHMAGLLIKHFDLEVLEVISSEPSRLTEVSGIGPKKAVMIHQSYLKQQEIKEVMLFLQGYDVSPSLAVRIFRHYGKESIPMLRENPYRLAEEVYGIGFITADKIARKLGLPFDSPQRVRAAVLFLLNQAADQGHVYLPQAVLTAGWKNSYAPVQGKACPKTVKPGQLLPKRRRYVKQKNGADPEQAVSLELPDTLIMEQLDKLVEEHLLFRQEDPEGELIIYAAPFYYAEKGAAQKLITLLQRQLVLFSPEETGFLEAVLQEEELDLAPEQVEAITGACDNGVMVITGGPGTGKTTINPGADRALRALQAQDNAGCSHRPGCPPHGRCYRHGGENDSPPA
jgi:exodeoxyribonuclease V alpha subunit